MRERMRQNEIFSTVTGTLFVNMVASSEMQSLLTCFLCCDVAPRTRTRTSMNSLSSRYARKSCGRGRRVHVLDLIWPIAVVDTEAPSAREGSDTEILSSAGISAQDAIGFVSLEQRVHLSLV